jgi:hypothetical protein
MKEQPQPDNLQQDPQEDEQAFYRADDSSVSSSFSGYDLTHDAEQTPPPTPSQQAEEQDILSWEASEYIHHTKSPVWFVVFGLAMLTLLAIAYFLTHSWTFVIVVVVMAIAMGVFANRPPRTLHYALTSTSIHIEQTTYLYSDFRAFGIIADGVLYSIMLIPTKRFMPAVSMYFDERDGEQIVDILGARLPMQELHLDVVDQVVRRLRF